ANPSHGKLDNFDKSDGSVTYTPDKDYSGDDDFKFKVTDDKGAESDKADVIIIVKSTDQPNQAVSNGPNEVVSNGPNQVIENQTARVDKQSNIINTVNKSPEAFDQSLTVVANDKMDITLVGDDSDKDPIQFAIVSNPSDASLNNFDVTKGTVTYTPQADYVGNDSFGFKVIDDNGAESNVATVSLDVKATTADIGVNDSANQSPSAFDQSTSVDKNNELNITLVGDDSDKDPIQFAIVSNPSDASLNNFDMTKGTVTYTPQADYVGNDSFGFKVIDDNGAESNVATVNVDVKENNQTNQAPQAFDLTTNESNLSNYRYLAWSAGEEEDRFILFARSTDGGNTFSSPISLSGNIRSAVFNPEVSSSGNNVYVVWQGPSKNGNQDILIRKSSDYGSTFGGVENVSNDPGGSGNPQVTAVGNSTHIAWEGTTPGNNFIFYTKSDDGSAFDSPQKLSSNLGVSYNPQFIENDNLGTDSFKYKVTDDKGAHSNVATVDVNTDAIARSSLEKDVKIASLNKNDEVDIKLKANDKDNDSLKYEIVTTPSEGSLSNFDSNSGTVTYVPNENNGIDLSWHNYMNGHVRTMTKNVDEGSSTVKLEKNDPFKAQR
ncbi:MAG TPA: tandem-95 repeat protein, partial [Nitrososphaeraceae archaeon]